MPYYATSQEWLRQSSLLIEARPTTTRITTKYHIAKPKPRRSKKSSSESDPAPSSSDPTTTAAAPRGSLTLKTYDPHSGVCLKYRTTKAAEVSRLILSLGRPLGTRMAALPVPEDADEVMADAPAEETGKDKEKKSEEAASVPAASSSGGGKAAAQAQTQQQQGGGGGGKGKKKRGKK
ncbi:signal recognition particle 9 kDa protein-domain-containing protein [Hypomontagnella submonticulosa]|nr:signal recognition particle 9 kDa protein-domain-containing protein [Hypomontagnella submonticulosa]